MNAKLAKVMRSKEARFVGDVAKTVVINVALAIVVSAAVEGVKMGVGAIADRVLAKSEEVEAV